MPPPKRRWPNDLEENHAKVLAVNLHWRLSKQLTSNFSSINDNAINRYNHEPAYRGGTKAESAFAEKGAQLA